MRKKVIISTVILALLVSNIIMVVFAQGPFDRTCPKCDGSGKISVSTACSECQGSGEVLTTKTCSACQGSGEVPITSTCPICHGSGEIMVWKECTTCYGSGEIEPQITRKSMDGWGTLVGLDWAARVKGVFHNEEDEGTYGKATSKVNTVTTSYYHTSPRTYFPPHQDVTIIIDTLEIDFLEDWTYTIYISSKDDITCPSCEGSGGESVIATCSECGGEGKVTTLQECSECDGSGEVTTLQACSECGGTGEITTLQTCPRCNGKGYITNQTAVNLSIIGVVVIIGSVVAVTGYAISRRKKKQT